MAKYGGKYAWEEERDNIESEAVWLGRDYMEGRKSINEVERYLNRTSHYSPSFTRTDIAKHIKKGADIAEKEGKAQASRVQPKQEPMKFRAKKGAGAGGKLASRPESTRYKPPTKEQKRERAGTRPYAARPAALNAYDVMAQRKKDLHELLNKHTRGQVGVREVKRESKTKAQGAAYKNVVYNETHHRYVGPNRPGAPPKKEFDYQPKKKRAPKKKTEDRYVFTYSQGGAKNQQVSLSAPTKEQAKQKFARAHPQATHVDIRLVMRGD